MMTAAQGYTHAPYNGRVQVLPFRLLLSLSWGPSPNRTATSDARRRLLVVLETSRPEYPREFITSISFTLLLYRRQLGLLFCYIHGYNELSA